MSSLDNMQKLTDTQKHAIFKLLANMSQYRAGVEFGLDKYFEKPVQIINVVNRIYRDVKENPAKFAISQDVIELVEKGMVSRKGQHHELMELAKDPGELSDKDLVIGVKRKAWVLLDEKLNYLVKHRKAFRQESLMSLAKMAGIAFDKAQIMKGEATEHIAIKAKVDSDITSQEAITQLLKLREALAQAEEQ